MREVSSMERQRSNGGSGANSRADSEAGTLTRFLNQRARQRALEHFSVVLEEIIPRKI